MDREQITFHLDVFDGPLDLLLHLLSQNKVDIKDIPIALILDQYLEYIRMMREFDMEVASEFITMAAQLMYIKSKMLLPVYEDEQPEDPRTELVEALLEYQRIKEASSVLDRMSDIGKDIFVKPQEILERDTSKIDYSYSADDLIKIFNNIFERSARRLPPPITAFSGIVGRESVPVELKIKQIGDMLIRDRQLDFDALVLASQNRSEMIAVFLAVLELSKAHQLTIEELGGKYMLKLSEGSNGAD